MTLLFSLFLLFSISGAQEIPLSPKFVQQNQHSTYFFLGSASLKSDCSLALSDQFCRFMFEDASGNSDQFKILYADLASKHVSLLNDLRTLELTWVNESVFADLFGRIVLTRGYDLEALQQIIHELEEEPLQERVLQHANNTRNLSPSFYSTKRARAVYDIFRTNLSP